MHTRRFLPQVHSWTHIISVVTLFSVASAVWSVSTLRASSQVVFAHVLSSGTFILPPNAHSVDWVLLNDSPGPQPVRVTVYRISIGAAKTQVGPGTATVIQRSAATHNANGVSATGIFRPGGMYEVVAEVNDLRVLPAVDVWSQGSAQLIPGTHINPKEFFEIR